jgi:dipeptidyl-peptidase-3
MKKLIAAVCIGTVVFTSCQTKDQKQSSETNDTAKKEFNYMADRFADIQVLRYEIAGFDELPLKQKQLAYYLYQAGLSGRDIFYDQKYKHNLRIRKTLEAILDTY